MMCTHERIHMYVRTCRWANNGNKNCVNVNEYMYVRTFCWAENLVWSKGLKLFAPVLLFVCVCVKERQRVCTYGCVFVICVWVCAWVCVCMCTRLRVNRSYACYDCMVWVPWLNRMCAMVHSNVWHVSFICLYMRADMHTRPTRHAY